MSALDELFAPQAGSGRVRLADLEAPGFTTTLKRSGGQMLGGIGEIYGDISGDRDNWAARTAEDIITRNPSGINSLQDVIDQPGLAATEAGANALTFLAPFLGAGKALQLANAGRAVTMGTQAALAGLPSVGEIGQSQRETGSENLVTKYGGAGLVGLIENLGGVQRILGPKIGREMTEAVARGAVAAPLKTFGKQWLRTGVEEGLEELAQTPIEQAAGGKELGGEEMAVGGVMGALGGLVLGPLGAGGHYSQASKLVKQIDEARSVRDEPLTALEQLPAKQQAIDFLTKVTANDFGSAQALTFADEQAAQLLQGQNTLLDEVAKTAESKRQTEQQQELQAVAQAAAQEKQKQIDDFIKQTESDIEKAAKEEQAAEKTKREAEGQQRTERNSGFVQPAFVPMPPPMPTDLLGDPLFTPLDQAPQTLQGLNDWLSQGLEINQRRQQIESDEQLRKQAVEMLDQAALGFGTQASPAQLPLVGPRGGIAPGVVPKKASPKQQVQTAAEQAFKAGAISQEQYADVMAGIAANVPASETQSRLGEYLGTNRSAPAVAVESPPQEDTDLGRGLDVAGAAGSQRDAGVRAGSPGGLAAGVEPVVPVAASVAQTIDPQEGETDEFTSAQAVESQSAETTQETAAPAAPLLTPKKVAPEWLMDELEGEYNLPGKKKSTPGALSSLVEDIDTKIQNYRDFIACLRG